MERFLEMRRRLRDAETHFVEIRSAIGYHCARGVYGSTTLGKKKKKKKKSMVALDVGQSPFFNVAPIHLDPT